MKKFTLSILCLCMTISLFATDLILTPGTPITHSLVGALTIYDDSGSDATSNYAINSESLLTLTPTNPNATISFELQSLDLGAYTFLYMYNGTNDNGIALKKIGNSQALGFVYESKTPGAAITLKFKTDNYTGTGFKLKAEENIHTPISLESLEAVAQDDLSITKGSLNVSMMQINAITSGDLNSTTISHIKIATLASSLNAISKASLYYTDSNDSFNTNTLISSVDNPTGIIDFDFSQVITTPGSHYFWVTYDINQSAPSQADVQAQMTAYTIDASEVLASSAPITSTQLIDALHGTYVVGLSGSADYTNLNAALFDLKSQGIEDAVVFQLEDGTYDNSFELYSIKGTSPSHTITFESADVTNKAVINATSAIADTDLGMVTLNDVQYVTFKNILFENANEWKSLFDIKDNSNNITIQDCQFTMQNDNTRGISGGVSSLGKELNSISILNCQFEGGKNGVSILGATSTTAIDQMSDQLIIDNCTFNNQHAVGIYLKYFTNVTINKCTIDNLIGTVYRRAIYMDACDNNSISNCSISVDGTGNPKYINAMYLLKSPIYVTSDIKIYNNTILMTNFVSAKSGIYLGSSTEKVDFAFNSVRMEGSGSARILSYYKIGSGNTVRNNILQQMGNGLVIRFSYSYDATDVTFSNNIYHSNGSSLAYVGTGNPSLNISDWNSLMNDTNSQDQLANFTSTTDLHLLDNTNLINAQAILEFPTDKDGVSRIDPITCGAYQFTNSTDPTSISNTSLNTASIWTSPNTLHVIGNNIQQIKVFNANGQCIYNKTLSNASIHLNQGIYLIQILSSDNTLHTQKVIL